MILNKSGRTLYGPAKVLYKGEDIRLPVQLACTGSRMDSLFGMLELAGFRGGVHHGGEAV